MAEDDCDGVGCLFAPGGPNPQHQFRNSLSLVNGMGEGGKIGGRRMAHDLRAKQMNA